MEEERTRCSNGQFREFDLGLSVPTFSPKQLLVSQDVIRAVACKGGFVVQVSEVNTSNQDYRAVISQHGQGAHVLHPVQVERFECHAEHV
jgi:hypothetical protein